MNGVSLVDDIVILNEQAQLNAVNGGIDEPIPRVLGFTIGVTLGLTPRRAPETSLLAVGTTGTELNAADVALARGVAKTVEGVMTVEEAQKAAVAAQAAGQVDRAKLLLSWLTEIAAAKKAPEKGRRTADVQPARAAAKNECGPDAP
jgi:hypothetical protein